jgi:hypothetical protein
MTLSGDAAPFCGDIRSGVLQYSSLVIVTVERASVMVVVVVVVGGGGGVAFNVRVLACRCFVPCCLNIPPGNRIIFEKLRAAQLVNKYRA